MSLADDIRALVDEIGDSREKRKLSQELISSATRSLIGDARAFLGNMRILRSKWERVSMVGTLRAHTEARRDAAQQERKNRSQFFDKVRSGTCQTLASMAETRKESGGSLRTGLANYRRSLVARTKQLKQEAAQQTAARSEERRKRISVLNADLASCTAHRRSLTTDRGLATSIWVQRTGATVAAAPPPAGGEAETPGYEEAALALLRDHPEGLTMAEIADTQGVHFVVFAQPLRNLIDTGLVRREGKTYYAVT